MHVRFGLFEHEIRAPFQVIIFLQTFSFLRLAETTCHLTFGKFEIVIAWWNNISIL